jgi:hypothetical protein
MQENAKMTDAGRSGAEKIIDFILDPVRVGMAFGYAVGFIACWTLHHV